MLICLKAKTMVLSYCTPDRLPPKSPRSSEWICQAKVEDQAEAFATSKPQVALQNPAIAAGLFRHYVDLFSPWHDLNDFQNLFGTAVPT